MILGHGKVNIIQTKQLTCGNHTQGDAETVQLVLYNDSQTTASTSLIYAHGIDVIHVQIKIKKKTWKKFIKKRLKRLIKRCQRLPLQLLSSHTESCVTCQILTRILMSTNTRNLS